jgi:serine/threonine-protein kinase
LPLFPAHFSISDSGTLIYLPGSLSNIAFGQRVPVWVDREGKEEPIPVKPDDYGCPRISPDGKKLAIVIDSGEGEDIWIWDLLRENWAKLTTDDFNNEAPLWTPDGRYVLFVTVNGNNSILKRKSASGTGDIEPLAEVPNIRIVPSSWSSDGKTLIAFDNSTDSEGIGLISIDNDYKWSPLLNKEFNELQPNVSPDGKWIAYVTDETGNQEVYLRPFPDVDRDMKVVSTNGGSNPLWSSDSKELFYRNGESVMAVKVQTEPGLELGKPVELFKRSYQGRVPADLSRQTMWDIHPDDNRFVMMKETAGDGGEPEAAVPVKINIILNWFEELKDKVPVD